MIRKTLALLLGLVLLSGVTCTGFAEIGALNVSNLFSNVPVSTVLTRLEYDPEGTIYPFTGTDDDTRVHTVMLYLCGSNLEGGGNGGRGGAATQDLKEILASEYDRKQISVLVMAGGSQKWFNDAVDIEDTAIYEALDNSLVKREGEGLKGMGEVETLTYFINYCYKEFPAKNYSLILWDHGGGPLCGLISDYCSGGSFKSVLKVREALDQTPIAQNKLYLLGFDACLEGSVEIAKVFAPYAKQMVASEESEPGYGWNYAFLKDLEKDEGPDQTGKRIIELYFEQYPKDTTEKITLSSIDLNRMDELMQKSGDFFSEVASHLDTKTFLEFAALRQKLEPVDMRNMDKDIRDLVDLQEMVETYSKYAPEKGQDLLHVIQEMITYEKHTSDGVSNGLSIYFPYYDAKSYRKGWNESFKKLEFDDAYTQLIEKFNVLQRENPEVEWSMGKKGEVRDTRTLLSIQLTPEQAANVAEYSLVILWQVSGDSEEDATYMVVNPHEEDTELDGVQLGGYYVHNTLCIIGEDGTAYPYPIAWTFDAAGHYVVPATLIAGDNATEIKLVCDWNEETGEMTVVSILVKDEIDGYFTSRVTLDLDQYETIVFSVPVYKPTRDGSGALIGVFDWDVDHVETYEMDLHGQWTLAVVEDSIAEEELFGGFVLTDYYRLTHTSELLPIVPAPLPYPIFVLTYDDDYLGMESCLDNAVSTNNGDIYVQFTLVNPTEISTDETGAFQNEHEIFVHFGDVMINGAPVDTELWIEGSGAFGGIPVGGQSTDTLILPGIELDSIQTVALTITVVDAETDDEIAVIPASGYLYIPNE